MSYIFLLDGIEFDSPVNDKDLTTTIKRGANLDGFLITQDADFIFTGAAYTYLYDKFFNDGFCSEVEVEILDECEGGEVHEVYTGIIKMSAIEIEEQSCTIRSKIQDNSFYSYVNNNKGMEISPTQTGTKTGESVIPPSIWDLDMFNPTNPINTGTWEHRGYRVYDLLEHSLAVMTDNKVGFVSDFLWNQMDELFITTGNALSEPGNVPTFTYTFEKLFTELNKCFNLSFFIETDLYSVPNLRIEPKDYFYTSSTGLTFNDVKELKIAVDQSKIYGTVLLGSATLSDSQGVYSFNENIPFYGFKQERFYPIGQCNLDTELNLVNDYVISSLVIEDCVIGASKDYYDNLFLISCENLDLALLRAQAIRYYLNNDLSISIYNLNLNNYNKAARYYGYLPANLLDSFNASSNNFHSEHAIASQYYVSQFNTNGTPIPYNGVQSSGYDEWLLTIVPFSFPDESTAGSYDLGGNYNNATYRYTIPSDGRYAFTSRLFIDNASPAIGLTFIQTNYSYVYVNIKRYDSLNVLQEENNTGTPVQAINGVFLAEGWGTFECVTGDYIVVEVTFRIQTSGISVFTQLLFSVSGQSFFESNADNVIVGVADNNYKVIRYEFAYPISNDDFRTLVSDPTGLQYFTKWSEINNAFRTRRAWVEEIRYNNWTGLAAVKLIANNAIIEE